MKNQFLSFSVFLLLLSCLTSACSKRKDLTENIVGLYEGSSGLQIVVTKIDNSTVSLIINGRTSSYTFANVKMNSESSFTLNTSTVTGYCYNQRVSTFPEQTTTTLSGTGTFSSPIISVLINRQTASTLGYYCPENGNQNIVASKQ